MYLFYTTKIEGDWATLEEGEARHCAQVLRKQLGDALHFVDGQGGMYKGRLIEVGKKSCRIQIEERIDVVAPSPVNLHLAVAPTKNIDRFEWFLEKATEIGISSITPLLCQRSERRRLRPERLERVLIAAMKQSLKAQLPVLNPFTAFSDFIQSPFTGQGMIAHCIADNKRPLKQTYQAGNDVCILIGPEGDFSSEEIDLALQQGFKAVSLGEARLRTETAALVACHSIHLLNQ